MRELKVRVWDRLKKQYVHDLYTLRHLVECSTEGFIYIGANVKDYPFILEPSTYIKDKNGKEIYEGDIIREKWYDSETHTGRDRIGKVEYFCDGYNCWFRGRVVALGMFPTKNIEVIGNIHDNPELLKKEK